MHPSFRRCTAPTIVLTILCIAGLHAHSFSAAVLRVSPYLTRAEAAAIVLFASPTTLPRVDHHPYEDVLPDDWFAPTVLTAAKLGILTPDASGTRIRPFGSVSRGAFLTMLSRSFGLLTHQPHGFSDVPAHAPYAPYAGTEATYRLFTHDDPTMLEPNRLVTQDEARIALRAFLEARSKAEEEKARKTAAAQSDGTVQLYGVISTKRQRVVLMGGQTRSKQDARPATPPPPATAGATVQNLRADVIRLVNAKRTEASLPPLAANAALERSAQAYAEQMETQGFFGHTDAEGKTLRERIDAVGYYSRDVSADCQCIKGFSIGENLARGQRTAEEAVTAWMESPSHRDAILGEDFTDIGIGISAGTWVQHFGGTLVPEQ